jgi:hypothetical protein
LRITLAEFLHWFIVSRLMLPVHPCNLKRGSLKKEQYMLAQIIWDLPALPAISERFGILR